MRAAMEYIHNTAHNAAYLLRMGEAAARSPDPRIAQAGRQLIDSALRLRANALLSDAKLYVRRSRFPEPASPTAGWQTTISSSAALASQLALMQHPTQAARLSTLL